NAGGSADVHFIRAHALMWLNRGQEADGVLAEMATRDFTSDVKARAAFIRATNMLHALADPAAAKQIIEDAALTMPTRDLNCIDAFLTTYWAAMGKPDVAIQTSKNVVFDRLPEFVAALTRGAVVIASGDAGRTGEATAAAQASYTILSGSSAMMHGRLLIADSHVGALLQAGLIEEAGEVAERLYSRASRLRGPARPQSAGLAGRAALGRGDLDTALSVLERAAEMLLASDESTGLGYRYQIPRVTALAIRGKIDEVDAALADLEKRRNPSYQYLDYEHGLARAWVAAAHGTVSEAISLAFSS